MAAKKTASAEATESAHKVWLAGIGALAVAEEEGSKLFSSLVKKGEQLSRSRSTVGDRMKGAVDGVRGRADHMIEQIESTIDEQVSSALNRLGIPSSQEIAELTRRIESLSSSLENLEKQKTKRKTSARTTGKTASA